MNVILELVTSYNTAAIGIRRESVRVLVERDRGVARGRK